MGVMMKNIIRSAVSLLLIFGMVGGDPDILSDFIVPENTTTITGQFFTYTGLRALFEETALPSRLKVTKVSAAEFPALAGQSVSYAILEYPAGTPNPPHVHPRSAELLFLIDGSLRVGFVDTAGVLYAQTLLPGDVFVFPKGLLHFQFNADHQNPAVAISAFGSASPGTSSVPNALFTTGINDDVLAVSFKTDLDTVEKLKAGLAPKP